MGIDKLLDKLGGLLSADRRLQREKRDKLKRLLKELKVRQKELKKSIEEEEFASDEERVRLTLQLQVVREQRKKGLALYKELKQK